MDKTYLALVRGGRKSFTETNGEIREPLDFVGGHVSIGTSAKAKFAATDWELVGSSVGWNIFNSKRKLTRMVIVKSTDIPSQIETTNRTEASTPCASCSMSSQ